ncbi:MAG TPA: glutathione S-transferase C-terminal domain-containing protein, partial [Gammaproteobacteria bacterium]
INAAIERRGIERLCTVQRLASGLRVPQAAHAADFAGIRAQDDAFPCDRPLSGRPLRLLPAFVHLFWRYYRTPERQRDLEQIARLQAQCEHLYDRLEDHLRSTRYLAGDSLTMGDVPAGTSLYRSFEMGLDVKRPPRVMDWYARLLERAPYRNRVAEPFHELLGRLDA